MLPSKNLKIWHTTIEQMLDVNHFNFMLNHFNLPNVDSLPQKKVNRLQSWRKREVLPDNDNFFHKLELDFLERIPKEFKENLISRGWGDV
jgi:hypothetical protein